MVYVAESFTDTHPSHVSEISATPVQSTSGSKIQNISTDTPKKSDPKITGYCFVDMELLSDIVDILCCPKCKMDTETF